MADRTFLDWPFFEEGHRSLARELEAWCEAELTDDHGEDVDQACRNLVAKLGAGGWLSHCVPDAEGKLDVRSLALIRETLARHSGLADFAFAMQGLGSGTISLFGTEEQKARYLPAVARGELIAAFALTEPESGSDVASISTSAEATEDGWVVNGAKTYISNGGIADYYILFARTGEAPGAKGLSAFIVDRDTPGLDDGERIEVIAPHPLATLRFTGMRLPVSSLLGERGAEMVLDVESSALLIYRAAWLRDVKGLRNSREAALAKLHATDSAQSVIDKAVQMFGGLGVTRGVAVERLYREIRALRIYEGASEVQKVVIARAHLAEYRR
jgi:acyl-CoA dehydrogenase